MKTNYMISGYGLRENQGTTYGCVFFGLFRSMAVWVRKAREASRHCRGTMAALCQHSRSILVVLCLFVGVCGAWGEVVLFHETFGDNDNSARTWEDSYSVKSGVETVYSNATYTVTNAKQGKNTTGYNNTSGLNQTTRGTDAVFIVGPLNLSNCSDVILSYYWNAGSTKKTYSTKVYYATSTGEYTEIPNTATGATSFVKVSVSVPSAALVSTAYFKVVFNTSNTQAIIDEFDLSGTYSATVTCDNKFTFSYWTGSEADTKKCFEQVGSTNEYQITEFTIPATNTYQYWVGYNNSFYNDNLGTSNAKSATTYMNQLPVANLQGSNCEGYLRYAATGAHGTLRIYDNSTANNLYVGFIPSGYQLRVGSGASWSNIQLTSTSGSVWETEIMELTAELQAKYYYVDVWTSGSYSSSDAGVAINNWTDGSTTIGSCRKKTGAANEDWGDLSSGDNGSYGKFRTWTDNCAANGYFHFVPYYNATFMNNGVEQSHTELKSVEVTNTITFPEPTARTGYTFGGWYDDGSYTGTKFDVDGEYGLNASTGSKTFYAKWTATEYSITYKDKDGADFSGTGWESLQPTSHTYNTPTTLVNPTKAGYRFDGWYIASDCSGEAVTELGATAYTADITLYAKWIAVYSITWLVNGDNWNTGHGTPTISVENGSKPTTLPTAPISNDCDGSKVFVGWTAKADYADANNAPADLFTYAANAPTITENTTFYAVFATSSGGGETTCTLTQEEIIAVGAKSYSTTNSVSSSCGGSWTGNFAIVSVDNSNGTAKGIQISKNSQNYRLTSPKFSGGVTSITINTNVGTHSNFRTAANRNFYIRSSNTTAQPSSGDLGYGTLTSAAGSVTIDIANAPTQFHIYVDGAAYIASVAVTYSGGTTYTDYVTTCCAQWAAPTISYNSGNALGTGNNYSVTIGSGTTYGDVTYTSSNEAVATVNASGQVSAVAAGSATITATWAGDGTHCAKSSSTVITVNGTVTVTYDANGGEGSMATQDILSNTPTALTDNAFTRTCYTFTGWNTAADGSGTSYADEASVSLPSNTTLYAQWAPITHTVTYTASSDKGTVSVTVSGTNVSSGNTINCGETVTITATPNSGYAVSGITMNGNSVVDNSFTMPSAEVTIVVTWAAAYTVTWSVGGVESTTPVVEGAIFGSLEKPTTTCENNSIYSWTAEPLSDITTTPPAIVAENATINANTTYYAVFSRTSDTGEQIWYNPTSANDYTYIDVSTTFYASKCIRKVTFYIDGNVHETQYVQDKTTAKNPASSSTHTPEHTPASCGDYIFMGAANGWTTTNDYTEEAVIAKTPTSPFNFNTQIKDGDKDLYAIFRKTTSVEVPVDGGYEDVSARVPGTESSTTDRYIIAAHYVKDGDDKYYALPTGFVAIGSADKPVGTDITEHVLTGASGLYIGDAYATGLKYKIYHTDNDYTIVDDTKYLDGDSDGKLRLYSGSTAKWTYNATHNSNSKGTWRFDSKTATTRTLSFASDTKKFGNVGSSSNITYDSYYYVELIPISTNVIAAGTKEETRYTYTTSPNCAPSITITGKVNVTAAKGQQAQAVKRFTVTANDLDKYKNVTGAEEPHYLRAFLGTNGSHFKLAWVKDDGSVESTGSEGDAVNTCSLSIGDSTTWRKQLAVFYTPDAEAEDDLQETVTITVYATSNNGSTLGSDGNKCAEAETTATGRALPSRFAIVATSTDGNTYALPNNMSTATTYSGMQVTITDGVVVNPPAEAVYTAQQVFGSGIDGSSDIGNIRAQERYILLRGEGDADKALWNGNGNTLKNDTKALNTVWQLQTEDLIDYKIISYTTSNSNLSLNVANGATKPYNYFGAYSLTDNGNLPTDKRKVRIVPIVDDPECHHYQPVIVTESSADGAITHEKITLNVSIANGGSQYSLTDYRYSLDEGATWTAVTASPVVIEGLTPETEYHVIFAGANNCTIAGEITVSTTEDLTPCENAPNNLRATVSPTTAHIEWGAHGNADGTTYYITLYEDPYLRKPIDGSAQSTTNTEYDYEDLSAGTEYWYQIYVVIDEMPCKSEVRSFITNNDAFDIVEWQTDGIIIEPWIDITGLTVETGQQEMVLIGDESDEVADELFFSKYFEAQSNVKMLGLYNGTKAAIDLSQYTIKITNKSASTKSGEAEWSTTQSFAILDEIAAYNKLVCGEARSTTLQPGEELILITYTKPKDEPFCSNTATVADQKIINCAVDNPNSGWEKYIKTTKLNFSGNDAVGLFKNGELIDIIGAHHNNGATGYLGENNAHGVIAKQDFMDDPGWYTANGDNISTSVVEDNYALSTNRCLLIRKKDVKSGANAVTANTADFVTLGGGTVGATTYANEWAGLQIPDGPDANKYINSCEGFNYVGEFNYKEYYTHYKTIGDPATDWAGMSRGDGTYKVTINDLETMSCNNIRVRLINGTDPETGEPIVVASQEAKVPIMITAAMTTASGAVEDAAGFVQHKENYHSVKLGADNTLAGKEHAVCKECDVVILDGATLQITKSASPLAGVMADGKKITLQARDVEVYTGGRLILDNHVLFNSLTIRALEDNVATANLQAFLHLTDDDGLHHEKRVRGTRWYFFSLPYDCYINDVTFRNGTQATYGTDWVLKYFDGQARANWSAEGKVVLASTKFWKVYEPADGILRAGQGYILGVETNNGTDTHKYRELHFPMAMANYITDNAVKLNQYYPNADEDDPNANGNMAKQLTVNAWGAKREQRGDTQWEQGVSGVVRPNNVGWNLIGVPFTDMYVPTKGISKMTTNASGIYDAITIDKDATNPEHDEVNPVLMTYIADAEGTLIPTSTNIEHVVYAEYDNKTGKMIQYQQRSTDITADDTPDRYIMKPFLSYFVQVPGRAVTEFNANGEVKKPGDVATVADLELDKAFVLQFEPAGTTGYISSDPSSARRRSIYAEQHLTAADLKQVYLALCLTNDKAESDYTTLRLNNRFKDGYEVGRDLVKMRGDAYTRFTLPVLASQLKGGDMAGDDMAFQYLPDSSVVNLPLTYWAAKAGQMTISLSQHSDINYLDHVYLFDNQENIYTDLTQTDYTFTTEAGNHTTRFYLTAEINRASQEIVVDGVVQDAVPGIHASSDNSQITLCGVPNGAKVWIYSAEGKLCHSAPVNAPTCQFTMPAAGVYYVRIETFNSKQTLPVVVK